MAREKQQARGKQHLLKKNPRSPIPSQTRNSLARRDQSIYFDPENAGEDFSRVQHSSRPDRPQTHTPSYHTQLRLFGRAVRRAFGTHSRSWARAPALVLVCFSVFLLEAFASRLGPVPGWTCASHSGRPISISNGGKGGRRFPLLPPPHPMPPRVVTLPLTKGSIFFDRYPTGTFWRKIFPFPCRTNYIYGVHRGPGDVYCLGSPPTSPRRPHRGDCFLGLRRTPVGKCLG